MSTTRDGCATANGRATTMIDPHEARQWLRHIMEPGCVYEVRILSGTTTADNYRPRTWFGFFDDVEKLIAALLTVQTATGLYITPNPVKPALLARACNRLRIAEKGDSTGNMDIDRRRVLLIDCDPARPAGISSTSDEHDAAIDRAEAVELFLHNLGWNDPIRKDSSNGAHLEYRIDEPAEDGGLVERCLKALAAEFDDADVKIDCAVFNAARIWKIAGTRSCKGDDTPDRPHRMSVVLAPPDAWHEVSSEQLAELAAMAPVEEKPASKTHECNGHHANGQAFDVQGFIDRNGLDTTGPHPWKLGGRVWEFNVSPMCEHGGDGPHVEQHVTGAISAGCPHNSCTWTWADLRAQFEPRERVFDGGDRYYDADSPQGRANNDARKAVEPNAIDQFALWAHAVLTRQKPKIIRFASYGSRLGEFQLGRGQVIVIGAPPGAGKTALIGQVVLDALQHPDHPDLRVLIGNVEMSFDALMDRHLAYRSGVGLPWIRHRDFDDTAMPRIQAAIDELRERLLRVLAGSDLLKLASELPPRTFDEQAAREAERLAHGPDLGQSQSENKDLGVVVWRPLGGSFRGFSRFGCCPDQALF